MNTRTKSSLIVMTLAGLSVANLAAYTGAQTKQEWLRIIKPTPETCSSRPAPVATKTKLIGVLESGLTAKSTYNCSNCTLYYNTNQHWCQHQATVCYDEFPWHENYEFERTRKWYRCPLDPWDVYICGNWIDSGCCGSSDPSEPACSVNGALCVQGTEPPEN